MKRLIWVKEEKGLSVPTWLHMGLYERRKQSSESAQKMEEVWALSSTEVAATEAYRVKLESRESLYLSSPVIPPTKKRKGVAECFWHCQLFDKISSNGWEQGFVDCFCEQRPKPIEVGLQEQSMQLQLRSWPWRVSCRLLSRLASSGPSTCIHTYLYKYTCWRIIFGRCRATSSKTYASFGIRKHRKTPNTTSAQIHI